VHDDDRHKGASADGSVMVAHSDWASSSKSTATTLPARPCWWRTNVFALYRDHYEGTQFDLTQEVTAGPYGDPHRFAGPYDGKQNDVTEDKKF
jgi:dipeptidase